MEILTESELLSAVEDGTIIKNGKKASCEGIKYDFILSSMALTVELGRPREIDQSKENANIQPGEIAFVMTEESLDLPDNIYCQLSTKRKLSMDGIVILGGLIIDPNYKGKLIFGLYNISPRVYPLLPGRKLVAGVFYKVDKKSNRTPESINNFPDELVKIMADSKPNPIHNFNAAVDKINNTIAELRNDMQAIKNQLAHDDKWKEDFQKGLSEISLLVKGMGEKLAGEIDTRTRENSDIVKEQSVLKTSVIPLTKIEKTYQILIGAIGTVVLGVIVYLITKAIG
jgi:dUTPase